MIFMLDFQASRWTMKGDVAGQAGNNHPTSVPTGVFRTSDGHINIAASGGALYERVCKALGLPQLLTDPRFDTPAGRSENRDALMAEMMKVTETNTSEHWIDVINKAGVPCGPINTIDKTFAEPQVKHLGIATKVVHDKIGEFDIVGQPINMSDAPQPDQLQPAPDPGQHTDAILQTLGYDQAAIDELRKSGVV
jgi:formyl-CoA transferase